MPTPQVQCYHAIRQIIITITQKVLRCHIRKTAKQQEGIVNYAKIRKLIRCSNSYHKNSRETVGLSRAQKVDYDGHSVALDDESVSRKRTVAMKYWVKTLMSNIIIFRDVTLI